MLQVLIHRILQNKNDLANLRSDVDKLDIDQIKNVPNDLSNLKNKVDKLVPVPVAFSKLSDVVKNNVVKRYVYDVKIKNIEDKIPDITNLAINTTHSAKINKVKNKIPNITNLATSTTALTAVENKIPDHSKYITTPEFNKLTAENFAARLAQANLPSKNDIANFVKKTYFDDKLKNFNEKNSSNKTKQVLVENELKKFQTFYSSLFNDQS